jgi:plasmid stabilization system protein ParE
MNIKLSPFAETDLEESYIYYNDQKEGLGNDFIKEVIKTFDRITENHEQFQKVYKDMRKALTEVFSFNVFFIVQVPDLYILGIFHTSRNPKKMKTRYKIKK